MRLAAILLLILVSGCGKAKPRVVLYCAQDREFAEGLLADFGRDTGIDVALKFDTEAEKSVGLYTELIRERDRPRCGVFWNNEILSTIRLQRQGLLEPYESGSAKTLPALDDRHACRQKLIQRSRERFAATRFQVETKINRWSLTRAMPL